MFPYDFWDSPIWKEAARAGLRQISRLVSGGNLAEAGRLAKMPGVLKPSLAGSQIRHLGTGSEGVADLVAHPEHGLAVRKLFDPKGISTPEMIARKEQMGRAIGENPYVAKFLGSSPTPQGAGTMHFSQFVSSKGPIAAPAAGSRAELGAVRNANNQMQIVSRKAGFQGAKDVRRGNMIWDAQTGNMKTVDYLPAQPGEFNTPEHGRYLRDRSTGAVERSLPAGTDPGRVVSPTNKGSSLFNTDDPLHRVNSDQLRQKMLGRGPAAPAQQPLQPPSRFPQGSAPGAPALGAAPTVPMRPRKLPPQSQPPTVAL